MVIISTSWIFHAARSCRAAELKNGLIVWDNDQVGLMEQMIKILFVVYCQQGQIGHCQVTSINEANLHTQLLYFTTWCVSSFKSSGACLNTACPWFKTPVLEETASSSPRMLPTALSCLDTVLTRCICAPSPDDGKLSFEEFKSYFSDGVLTAEELKELFHTIDTHNTE